jgi:hypothetical protein
MYTFVKIHVAYKKQKLVFKTTTTRSFYKIWGREQKKQNPGTVVCRWLRRLGEENRSYVAGVFDFS